MHRHLILLMMMTALAAPAAADDDNGARRLSGAEQLAKRQITKLAGSLRRGGLEALASKTFRSDGKALRYRLFEPAEVDEEKRYPLVLYLHGAQGRGRDNTKQVNGGNVLGARVWTLPANQKKHPCYVVAPQCPRQQTWGNARRGEGKIEILPQPSEQMKLVIGLLASLQKNKRIDPRRIYVTGQSMGGMGTWDLIARYPRRFAAAAPVCGKADLATATKLSHMPIWMFHGDRDPKCPVTYSRRMHAALVKAGSKTARFWELGGVGHNSWDQAYANPKLIAWLFAQRLPEEKKEDH